MKSRNANAFAITEHSTPNKYKKLIEKKFGNGCRLHPSGLDAEKSACVGGIALIVKGHKCVFSTQN